MEKLDISFISLLELKHSLVIFMFFYAQQIAFSSSLAHEHHSMLLYMMQLPMFDWLRPEALC
jgi:hypothetical protein